MKILYWNNCVKDVCTPFRGSGKATSGVRVLCHRSIVHLMTRGLVEDVRVRLEKYHVFASLHPFQKNDPAVENGYGTTQATILLML